MMIADLTPILDATQMIVEVAPSTFDPGAIVKKITMLDFYINYDIINTNKKGDNKHGRN